MKLDLITGRSLVHFYYIHGWYCIYGWYSSVHHVFVVSQAQGGGGVLRYISDGEFANEVKLLDPKKVLQASP